MTFSEQDIVNAICLYLSQEHNVAPEVVEVELIYDDEEGFLAEAFINEKKIELSSFEMIRAIRLWLDKVLNKDPFAASIKLLFDRHEGIIASID